MREIQQCDCLTVRDELRELANIILQTDGSISESEMSVLITATLFLECSSDFPYSPEASIAVNSVIEGLGWEFSRESLIAAHGLCREHGQYWPLAAALAN